MNSNEIQSYIFEVKDEQGNTNLKGKITGSSALHFYDDLKLRAAAALLNSVDQDHFKETPELFKTLMEEIEETLEQVKKHGHFQGRTR
ncbi:hypothetical protein [Peribacillus kribbensis]|uniref:hypothetical protein n=1 Tax=Peribacillus kribbensis TaxID=356658 RepID=UPI00042A653E|nr:hypothetical protein [Peribacillus kribbensis]